MLCISIQQVTNIVTNNMTPNNVITLDTSQPIGGVKMLIESSSVHA